MEKPEVKAGPEALAEREKEEGELMRIVSRVRREVRRVFDEIKGHVTSHPTHPTPTPYPRTGAPRVDEIKGHVTIPHPPHLTYTPYSRCRCAACWTRSRVM